MSDAWRPDPGDHVAGTVIGLDEGSNFKGEPYPIVTLDIGDGQAVKVHALHQVLQQELAKRAPRVGDPLEVTYHGQPDGKDYHRYTVAGGSRPAGIDWGRYGDPLTADDDPSSAGPTHPLASGPAAPPASAATSGAAPSTTKAPDVPATAGQLNAISRILEAVWHTNSARADELRASINRAAGGPYDQLLTAAQAEQTLPWLQRKATDLGVTVEVSA